MSPNPHSHGKTADELVDALARPVAEPGSPVFESVRAAIDVAIARDQLAAARELHAAAEKSLTVAKLSAFSSVAATMIALVALLVGVL